MNDDFLDKKLNERKQQHAFRSLKLPGTDAIDFCSNDYLGIVKNKLLHGSDYVQDHGSTGSRLLTGNYPLIEETEAMIARFHQSDAALIFNSGYDANLGLLSSNAQRGDTICYDHLSQASIRDGIRLSFAHSFSFAHNDLDDLGHKLQKATGSIFVVTESVFSMDGDTCPLENLVLLCKRFNAHLIIDEAHATGVIGAKGEGLVQDKGLHSDIFARIHTFGKACGAHGAVVLGSKKLRDYLVNFARSFIYSTSLPAVSIAAIKKSYEIFPSLTAERAKLGQLIGLFKKLATNIPAIHSDTPIQGIMIPGNEKVKAVASHLQASGFDIRPILYPTVPKGAERLRLVLHAFNTEQELEQLLKSLKNSL